MVYGKQIRSAKGARCPTQGFALWFAHGTEQLYSSYVPGLSQTSAIMSLQSSRRSATLRNSDLLFAPLLTQVFKLSKYVSLWRPRSLFPSILPVRTALSKSSFLYTCPRKDNCLFLIVWASFSVTPAHRRTSSFFTFSVQEIRKIRRRNHISGASILLSMSLSKVQLSQP